MYTLSGESLAYPPPLDPNPALALTKGLGVLFFFDLRSSVPGVAATEGDELPTDTGNAHRAEHEKLPTYPRVWDKGE